MYYVVGLLREIYYYIHATCVQVQTEFKLMFGDDIPEKMLTNWNNILPALLRFGDVEVPETFIEQTMYKAIEIIDKAFHSSGVTAKSDPAFVIYEVLLTSRFNPCITHCTYCLILHVPLCMHIFIKICLVVTHLLPLNSGCGLLDKCTVEPSISGPPKSKFLQKDQYTLIKKSQPF